MPEKTELQKYTREQWVIARDDEDGFANRPAGDYESALEQARDQRAAWTPGRPIKRLWKRTEILEEQEIPE